jgi:ABC-type lipoprotein export system ATPase subunit
VSCITGESGCGKSTLLSIIGLLQRPTDGVVAIGGQRVNYKSAFVRSALRKKWFGYVFQSSALLPKLTVVENVMLPLRYSGVASAMARQRALCLLGDLQVPYIAERKPTEISTGEKQRAAFARAMACEPKILLADEPTGNVDPLNSRNIFNQLVALAAERGTTVIVVTHDMALASQGDCRIQLQNRRGQFAPDQHLDQ